MGVGVDYLILVLPGTDNMLLWSCTCENIVGGLGLYNPKELYNVGVMQRSQEFDLQGDSICFITSL